MALFNIEIPYELMNEFKKLEVNTKEMIEDMTKAGAKVVYDNVVKNMRSSFKDSSKLTPYLKITRTYKLKDGSTSTKVAFYGYYKEGQKTYTKKVKATSGYEYKTGKQHRQTRTSTGRQTAEYSYNGIPVPLIVAAREYGSKSGEAKKPFFRKSFKKAQIEQAMLKEQERFLPKE